MLRADVVPATPQTPRFSFRSTLERLALLLLCLASGSLECGGLELSPTQRHGEATYHRMCAVCHGRDGEGYRADQAPALGNPQFLASVSDAYLKHSIARGRSGTTMSAWGRERGGPLSSDDVEGVVEFMRAWERLPRAVLDERSVGGESRRGAQWFDRDCKKCHGEKGLEGPNVHIGSPDLLSLATNGFLRHALGHGRPGTPMADFSDRLGAGGIEDVLALMRSWELPGAGATKYLPPARPPPIPLGPVPLNPRGPEPIGFRVAPATTPADAVKAQMDRGAKMALLDARAPSDYTGEHIAGAVSVPFYDPDPYFGALPRDAWLVCYCACPHAESGQLAEKLVAKGFTKVTILDEGIGVWRFKKYPTRTGWEP
jgi:cytochrome c oxidase cbb3-type subunit 3/ubiquinol-cytochrome c reductase cytochrome c subunit